MNLREKMIDLRNLVLEAGPDAVGCMFASGFLVGLVIVLLIRSLLS